MKCDFCNETAEYFHPLIQMPNGQYERHALCFYCNTEDVQLCRNCSKLFYSRDTCEYCWNCENSFTDEERIKICHCERCEKEISLLERTKQSIKYFSSPYEKKDLIVEIYCPDCYEIRLYDYQGFRYCYYCNTLYAFNYGYFLNFPHNKCKCVMCQQKRKG